MHFKTDSDGTSNLDASWPPTSPRRPIYYVQSPSNHDAEKMSYGSSPTGSPANHYYHCSPIHHSRESSTTRFSASLKNPRSSSAYKHIRIDGQGDRDHGYPDEDDDDGYNRAKDGDGVSHNARLCFIGFFSFVLLFTLFCVILWGASKSYEPEISVKSMVFENFNVQAGVDQTGLPTDMLSLNSTVKIQYRNPATFFAVHVTSTPLELHYYQLKLASGQMKKFSQSRKTQRTVVTVVQGYQVPLYGGVPFHVNKIAVPLNLTFVMRSRAYILGRLVKSKFYRRVRCTVTLTGKKLGRPHNLTNACVYR